MDDAEARRWLASLGIATDALTDDLVREAARLLADVMDAGTAIAKAPRDDVLNAVERSRRAGALWEEFQRQHADAFK